MSNIAYSSTKKNKHGKDKWPMRKINCLTCGKKITTRVPYKKFCSDSCSSKAREQRRKNKLLEKHTEDNGKMIPSQSWRSPPRNKILYE